MNSNIWKRLRRKIDIPTNEIAYLLQIPEEKYIEIETGVRQMPKKLIDSFMKIYHERKEVKGETQIKMFEVNQFLKEMNLDELKKEFGYKTNKSLALAIGIGACQIYRLKKTDKLSDNTKMKVYNFFNDPLNIVCNDKKECTVKINNKEKHETTKHTFDEGRKLVNYLLDDKKMTRKEIAKQIDVHTSTISNWASGAYGISNKNYEKLLTIANKDTENVVNTEETTENAIENNKPIDIECLQNTDERAVLLKLLDELTNENITLKTQILRYEKLIDRM